MLSLLDQAGAKSWCTLNGNFHTEEEVSQSSLNTVTVKVCNHSPNIVEYDDDKLNKPVFKFILGPETKMKMKKGLSQQVITKDESPCIKRFANA